MYSENCSSIIERPYRKLKMIYITGFIPLVSFFYIYLIVLDFLF